MTNRELIPINAHAYFPEATERVAEGVNGKAKGTHLRQRPLARRVIDAKCALCCLVALRAALDVNIGGKLSDRWFLVVRRSAFRMNFLFLLVHLAQKAAQLGTQFTSHA